MRGTVKRRRKRIHVARRRDVSHETTESVGSVPAYLQARFSTSSSHSSKPSVSGKGVGTSVQSALNTRGSGTPLKEGVKAKVEPALRSEMSDVRVHEDAKANQAAQTLSAKAFTHGNDIWLGRGEQADDVRLMAHESTHVLQQSGKSPDIQRDEAAPLATTPTSAEILATWSTTNLIREYIDLPPYSSDYRKTLSAILKARLRYSSSLRELNEYQALIFSEGHSDQPGVNELLEMISYLVSLLETRESELMYSAEEQFVLEDKLKAEEAETPYTTTVKKERLKRRIGWRAKLLLATRPTRKWVLLHRGLIEELRIQYESSEPTSELDKLANLLHKQQQLLAWALQQDIEAINLRVDQILNELGGASALYSEAASEPSEFGMPVSSESEEARNVLKTEYLDLAAEQDEEKKELDLLRRSFNKAKWEAINNVYKQFPRHPPPMWCMRALYKGLGGMFSPEESKRLEKGIYKESLRYGRRPGKEAGHYRTVDRMMINLGKSGKTGPVVSSIYNKRMKRYAPNLRDLVLSLISRDQPGWYMFGLSLHSGYHSVALAVKVGMKGEIDIYWLDQKSRGGFSTKNNVSTVKAMDKKVYKYRPSYGYKRISIWPIIPSESFEQPEEIEWRAEEAAAYEPDLF